MGENGRGGSLLRRGAGGGLAILIFLLALALVLFGSEEASLPARNGSERDSPRALEEAHRLAEPETERHAAEEEEARVSIEFVGAAAIDAQLSVSAWVESPGGRLWEVKADPASRLVKFVPPKQDVMIVIPKSQFGDTKRRKVHVQPGETARLVFDLAMPVAVEIQLTGMPEEIVGNAFVTVYDAASGDSRWNFQHCRTDSTGSVRLAYAKPRMLKASMRQGTVPFELKLADGGEIFSSDIGYAVVEPIESVIFVKALIDGREADRFDAFTSLGPAKAEAGILPLYAEMREAMIIARKDYVWGMWQERASGRIDLALADPKEIAHVNCTDRGSTLTIQIENHEQARSEGIEIGVYGPSEYGSTGLAGPELNEPHKRRVLIDGPSLTFDSLLPGTYSLYWLHGKHISRAIEKLDMNAPVTRRFRYTGKRQLRASLRDAQKLMSWIGESELQVGLGGRRTRIPKSGEFELSLLSESLPESLYFSQWMRGMQFSDLPVTAHLQDDRVEFVTQEVRFAKVVKPLSSIEGGFLDLKYSRSDKVFFMSVRPSKQTDEWRLLLLQGQDYGFAVTEGSPSVRKRLRGFVYFDGREVAVSSELPGGMGTLQVGELPSGVTLLARDRLGSTFEMAHLLPNSRAEIWLPELRAGEEFVVEGCRVTYDRAGRILKVE